MGGIEIISSARAFGYAQSSDECGAVTSACWPCSIESAEWLNMGQPYGSITGDPAPWYDPAVPESAMVLGIVGISVEGVSERKVVSVDDSAREMIIRFDVFLADECARDYAHGWLAAVFSPSPCADGCVGAEVCMLTCCPDVDPDTGELVGPDPLRYLYDVLATSGPTLVSEFYDGGGGVILSYEVTLSTNNLFVWRSAGEQRTWTVRPADGPVSTVDLLETYEACPPEEECAVPPECEPVGFEPLPAEPLPRCYPADPFQAHRTVIGIPPDSVPSGVDVMPVIRVTAGSTPLRKLVVRFYVNPLGVSCDLLPDLNPCRACTDMTVAEVPADSVLLMDGRTGRNTLTCPGSFGRSTSRPASVYGPPIDGVGAGYLDPIQCGPGLCVEVFAEVGAAPSAEVDIQLWTMTNGA